MKSSYLKIFLVLYLIQFCFAIHIPVNGISYTCKEHRVCEDCVCDPAGTVTVIEDDVVVEVGKTDSEYDCMRAVAVLADVTEGVTGYFSWNEDDEICSMCTSDAIEDSEEKTDVFEVTCSEDSDEKFMDAVGVTSIIVLILSILTCICLTSINKCNAEKKAEEQMDFQKVVNASRLNLQIDDVSDDEAAETSMPRPASIPTKTSSEDVHREHANVFKAESNDNWTDESKANLAEEMQVAMQQMQDETKANDNNPMDG